MKKLILLMVFASFALTVRSQSCPNVFKCGSNFVDPRDSMSYPTVQIGTQCWFQTDLAATKYINGDSILHITNSTSWCNLNTGAWCDYNNSSSEGTMYGHLYNWYAVNDNRGLCPMGWYVPTVSEWNILINYLGNIVGIANAGTAMKSTSGWNNSENGTNSSGFNAFPVGGRVTHDAFYTCGSFITQTYEFCPWTSTLSAATTAWDVAFYSGSSAVLLSGGGPLQSGGPIRCVREY